MHLHPCDNYEIIGATDELDSNKSLGYIDIPITLFELSKFIIASAIRSAFKYSIEDGVYPDISKAAKVIPIHKGGPQSDLGWHRPISVLSLLTKFLNPCYTKD